MKVQYTSANGRLVFDFEAASHKDVMAKLAAIQKVESIERDFNV